MKRQLPNDNEGEDAPVAKRPHRVLKGCTRDQLAVAFLAGVHPRSGANSPLLHWGTAIARLLFEMAVPKLDVYPRFCIGDLTKMYGLVADGSTLSPRKFDIKYPANQYDLYIGGRCDTTVAQAAIERDNEALLKHVCKRCPELVRLSRHSFEPIHGAAMKGRVESCEFLLRAGANVNAVSYDIQWDTCRSSFGTALDIAIATDNSCLFDVLVAHGGCVSSDADKARLKPAYEKTRNEYLTVFYDQQGPNDIAQPDGDQAKT